VNPEASSTAEILFNYFSRALQSPLPPDLAEPLFYAVASDTGWMQFANTSSSILRMLADLADIVGLQFDDAYNRLKNNWTCDKFRLYIEVLSSIDVSDGVCAFIHCDQHTFAKYPALNNVSHSTEAFVEHLKHIAEREVYVLLKQKDDKTGYRVSIRSKGTMNVQQLSAAFGGGGHILAAGCTIDLPELADVKQAIRKQLAEQREGIFDF
jgi:phosphoesterase RecJ-like protein